MNEFYTRSIREISPEISESSPFEGIDGNSTVKEVLAKNKELKGYFFEYTQILKKAEQGADVSSRVAELEEKLDDVIAEVNFEVDFIDPDKKQELEDLFDVFALATYMRDELLLKIEVSKEDEQVVEKANFSELSNIINQRFISLSKVLEIKSSAHKVVNEKEIENLVLQYFLSVFDIYIDFSKFDDKRIDSVQRIWRKSKKRKFDTKLKELLSHVDLKPNEKIQIQLDLELKYEGLKEFIPEQKESLTEEEENKAREEAKKNAEEVLKDSEIEELEDLLNGIELDKVTSLSKEEALDLRQEIDDIYDSLGTLFEYKDVHEDISKRLADLEKKKNQIFERLDRVLNPDISKLSMYEVVTKIKEWKLDPFRFAEAKSPSSAMSEEKRAYYNRYMALLGTSVFEDSDVRESIINNNEHLLFKDDGKEKLNEKFMGLLLDFFEDFKLGRKQSAGNKLKDLKSNLSKEGVSEKRMNDWGLEVFRYLEDKEAERLYWKVNLQLNAMSNEMEHEDSASRDRSMLYNEMKRCLLRRDELMAATTYHPDFGEGIREALLDTMYRAALRKNEVVVERTIKRKNYTVDLVPFYEEKKILQKVVFKEYDDQEDKLKAFEEWKNKLRQNGEKIVYEPDPDGIAEYTSLGNGQGGQKNLDTYIASKNLTHYEYDESNQTNTITADLFKVFDLLTISLTELQKNTQTRQHNGSIDDKDRGSLFDPLAGAIHRMHRYDGNFSDWAMYILNYYDPLQGETRFYSKKELSKRKFDEDPVFFNAAGKEVSEEYTYYFAKNSKGNYDHSKLLDLQQALGEYNDAYFDWFGRVPRIRQRGFCEPLGFSTQSLLFLNGKDLERSGKDEAIINRDGLVKSKEGLYKEQVTTEEPNSLDGLLKLSGSGKVTEFNLYKTAEENGLLGLLEQLYGSVSGGKISREDLFTGKAVIHGLYKTWGRIKMYPGGLREMFVPFSYDYIMRAVHSCKDLEEPAIAKKIWSQTVGTLIRNYVDGGLSSYKRELAQLINLMCKKPLYKEEFNEEKGKFVFVETGNEPEPANSFFDHNEKFSKINRYKVTKWMLDLFRERESGAFSDVNDEMERPDINEVLGVVKDLSKLISNAVKKGMGWHDYDFNQLVKMLKGEIRVGRPVENNGTQLIQEKDTDK